MPARSLGLALLVCAVIARAAVARADVAAPHGTDPATVPKPEYEWKPEWRRFGPWDYTTTAVVLGTYYAVEFGLDGPARAHWTKPVPGLDEPFRSWLRLDTRQARERADLASDVFWYASVAYPVFDSVVTPLARGADLDFIWQLSMMNVQAFAVVSLLIRIPHKTLGRMRPNDLGCQNDPNYDEQCASRGGRLVSFPGGHLAVSMTGAGLSCAHHEHADLYGGGLGDTLACASALGVAGAVAVTRLQADRHWVSDQIVGGLLGFAVGYGLPTWLYYEPFWRDDRAPLVRRSGRELPIAAALVPWIGAGEYGLGAAGVF